MSEFSFDQLEIADLVVDATYRGGTAGNTGDDPLCKLMPCGNQGGFRFCGSVTKGEVRMCILYSALSDPDWPDRLNLENGIFTYFGDNKKPGHELHDTPRGGNGLIRDAFAALHADERQKIPPFFIFTKGGRGRDVVFRGLAAPGGLGLRQTDDLVAVWKSRNRERFQNYRANFTVLSTAVISHEWIDELRSGDTLGTHCPAEWREFVERGKYVPLMAIPSVLHRKTTEQLPTAPDEVAMLNAIVRFFKSHVDKEYAFERCAAELFRMMDTNVTRIETTQFIRDGGRDAVGSYRELPYRYGRHLCRSRVRA